ncbi:DNA-directed RNA polymerase III complex subunit Rpc25 [Sporothrix epigloea]|uniref:DNA-directed RNA polymerase subunit n=1 Tax=Sporothrix epigloea TaxID=1892477 RepID=A0ABP0DPS6_9PEZI
MFILTKIADLVQISPNDFSKRSTVAIEDNINAKYSNKVIQKIGLCICLYDLLWTSEGLIGHGDGFVNVNVEFRLIVFHPFKGEVMFARISSCSPNGIHLRTDFFDDILVPFDELPDEAE